MTLVPASSSRFFCWIGVSAASTISKCASSAFAIPAISSTWPLPSRVAGRTARTRNGLAATTSIPIASASPSASSTRASAERRAPSPGSSGTAMTARSPRETSIAPLPSKLFSVALLSLAALLEVERMRRLERRDGMLVDQLQLAATLEDQAELVEPGHRALKHHAIDQEDGHPLAGARRSG